MKSVKGDTVSSGGFSVNSNTSGPAANNELAVIILDQVSLGVRVKTANHDYVPSSLRSYKSYLGPEKLLHPSTAYFSDPMTYNHPNGGPYIFPCGRHSVQTNGRRIYRAYTGMPLPHRQSLKRAPSEKKILEHEQFHNQFTADELTKLLQLEGVNPSAPYKFLLDTYFSQVAEMIQHVITEKKLGTFNRLSALLSKANIYRVELYLEIPSSSSSDDDLVKAFRHMLCNAFGSANVQRGEYSNDDEYKDTFWTWLMPANLLSSRFNSGKKKFAIKFYKKGSKIRIEIQANSPSLKRTPAEVTDAKMGIFRPALDKAHEIAEILAGCLRSIENEALKALPSGEPPAWPLLFDQMKSRCHALLTRSSDSIKLTGLLELIAKQGYVETKDALKLGINRRTLTILSGAYGFLLKRSRGLADQNASTPVTRNPIYVLIPERLLMTYEPEPVSNKKASSPTKYIDLAYHRPSLLDDCAGSAAYHADSVFNAGFTGPMVTLKGA